MSEDQSETDKRGFKVEDRRRFSETGEPRPEPPDSAQAAPPPQPGGAATAAPAPPEWEINFSTFVISLSTQALAHLGEIPHPLDNQTTVDLGGAKQLIDILGILKDKTKGNLDESEGALLNHVLYDLRLKYVERARAQREAAPR